MTKPKKKVFEIAKEAIEPAPVKVAEKVVAKAKEAVKKGRGHYQQKECPYCHIHVGNLGNHIRMKHPTETPPVELTKENLLKGKATPLTIEPAPVYYCTSCKAKLRKGENPCWHCGATLNWEGI